ncbi:aarF domain-containing protein kinase 1 isoform X3 [Festucalex cinctus]
MALRLLKVPTLATAVFASSGFYLFNRRLDFNDLSLIRFGRAAATTAVISYDYLTAFKYVEYGTEEYWALKSKVHQRSAERLRDLCCSNRGTFIKVGQHLGALDYLLPEEYTSTLKVLHSQAPQSSMEEIEQVIREELGKELPELFAFFDETPQGAASLAQVHKAVLHDGRTVAVKVQHPKVQRQSSKDILVMEVLLRGVRWLFPDFAFMWLVEEAKKNMPLELDFLNEGHNSEMISKKLSHLTFLKVPAIHWDLSTKRVLTMEFAEGGQVNDREYMKEHDINVNEISEKLGKMYSEMIFIHGFVHCDPHPGNVLVRKGQNSNQTEIVLLDHGLYQTLSKSTSQKTHNWEPRTKCTVPSANWTQPACTLKTAFINKTKHMIRGCSCRLRMTNVQLPSAAQLAFRGFPQSQIHLGRKKTNPYASECLAIQSYMRQHI